MMIDVLCCHSTGKTFKLDSPYGDELPAKGFDPGEDTYQVILCFTLILMDLLCIQLFNIVFLILLGSSRWWFITKS